MSIAISYWLISAEYNDDNSEDTRILNSLFVILLSILKVLEAIPK